MEAQSIKNPVLKFLFFPFRYASRRLTGDKGLQKKVFSFLIFFCILLPIWGALWIVLVVVPLAFLQIELEISQMIGIVIAIWTLILIVTPLLRGKVKLTLFRGLMMFIAFLLLFNGFIVSYSTVGGTSMEPTIKNNQIIWISRLDRNFNRGDIVVFRDVKNPDISRIDRIIATPGDRLMISDNKVYLNGEVLNENYTKGNTAVMEDGFLKPAQKVVIPKGNVFVLSDHGRDSYSTGDSRFFGFVPLKNIKGKVISP